MILEECPNYLGIIKNRKSPFLVVISEAFRLINKEEKRKIINNIMLREFLSQEAYDKLIEIAESKI